MPHEVIMPALGMAQDTGLIVAWLKKAGDKVATGDALMEVETDKATMEVEAAHDGYLTDVRAAEGENVPVGDVVALISESPESSAPPPAPKDTPEETAAAPAPARAEGKPVIMPALGMAQDTGTIVAWLKAPGDQVAAGDPLLEVETDKATMEVEAGHDGWIAELIGRDGEAIPVGEVIAIISAGKPDSPAHRSAAEAPKAAAPAGSEAPKAEAKAPDKGPTDVRPKADARPTPKTAPSGATGGRILASPKARRLAAEQGLDLARLAEAGYPQPYHVADLETLKALPAAGPEAAASTAQGAMEEAAARVPATEFDAFLVWAGAETGAPVGRGALLASFAAASLRAAGAGAGDATLAIRTEGARQPVETYTDPDLSPLGALAPADAAPAPMLTIRDLTASRLILARGGSAGPTLTATRDGDDFTLTLEVPAGRWPEGAPIACLDALAARIEAPLRHLL